MVSGRTPCKPAPTRYVDGPLQATYLAAPCRCAPVSCRPGLLRRAFQRLPQPPSGDAWLHEIKHDGFRVIARKEGKRVKLYSRPGNDLTHRFPQIIAVELDQIEGICRARSCSIFQLYPWAGKLLIVASIPSRLWTSPS
jgi:ATP dependent DNA ligase domain